MLTNRKSDTRLLIAGPYPDESISSILHRAGSLYGLTAERIIGHLCARAGMILDGNETDDLDNPEPEVLEVIAESLALPVTALLPCVIKDDVKWISHNFRNAYCPLCFLSDWRTGKSPYFRRKWALVWNTMCDTHEEPLIGWPRSYSFPASWQYLVSPETPFPISALRPYAGLLVQAKKRRAKSRKWNGHRLKQKLISWESELMGLQEQEPISCSSFPTSAQNEQLRCAAILVTIFGLNRTQSVERLPAPAGILEAGADRWIPRRGPLMNPLDPLWDNPWMAFRACGDPGARRGAICMAAMVMRHNWPVPTATGFLLGLRSASASWWRYILRYLSSTGWSDESLEDLQEVMEILGASRSASIRGYKSLPIPRNGQQLSDYVRTCKTRPRYPSEERRRRRIHGTDSMPLSRADKARMDWAT